MHTALVAKDGIIYVLGHAMWEGYVIGAYVIVVCIAGLAISAAMNVRK